MIIFLLSHVLLYDVYLLLNFCSILFSNKEGHLVYLMNIYILEGSQINIVLNTKKQKRMWMTE